MGGKIAKKQKQRIRQLAAEQALLEQKKRDLRATELIILRILGEMNKHEGYGTKRLQRLYDYLMLEGYKDCYLEEKGLVTNANDSYYSWGVEKGLTPREFEERQQKALAELTSELRKEAKEHGEMQA